MRAGQLMYFVSRSQRLALITAMIGLLIGDRAVQVDKDIFAMINTETGDNDDSSHYVYS